MNANFTTSLPTRLTAFAVAVLTSAVVLGSTLAGMQPRDDAANPQLIALDRITIRATPLN
jgi:hypothetical protein